MTDAARGAYTDWIAENVVGTGYGKCAEVTTAMAMMFPELTRVRGHYYCPWWGERAHWWLATPEGEIVDPTAAQFPSQGAGEYVPWREGDPQPTGKCLNCGEYAYHGDTFCSRLCADVTAAEFNRHRGSLA